MFTTATETYTPSQLVESVSRECPTDWGKKTKNRVCRGPLDQQMKMSVYPGGVSVLARGMLLAFVLHVEIESLYLNA